MSISFNEIPDDNLVPYTFVEFDSSQALEGLAGARTYKVLLIGLGLPEGLANVGELIRIDDKSQATKHFGVGSQLHQMVIAAFNNSSSEIWAIPVAEPEGSPAQGAITLSGEDVSLGVLNLAIGGRFYAIPIENDHSANALTMATKINADPLRYVTAMVDQENTQNVILTSRHLGEALNDLQIVYNYHPGETLPVGLQVEITPMAAGSGNPDLGPAIEAMGDHRFDNIALPVSDFRNLEIITRDLEERWGPIRQNDGHGFVGAYGEDTTRFERLNTKQLSILSLSDSITPAWEWAAAVSSLNALHASIDPARPYQTLEVKGVQPPKNPFKMLKRNTLLKNGISTFRHDLDGTTRIERLVTIYKRNEAGAEDIAYRDLNTKQTLSFLRWDFRTHFMQKFPRHKLADDGTRFAAGQKVLTPSTAKAEAISKFRQWESRGLVENADAFKRALVVRRNDRSPNRLDFMLPPNLMNQLRINAVQIGFRL